MILLHGLGRTRWSMELLTLRLRRQGFDAHTFGYASLSKSVAEIADALAASVAKTATDGEIVHFVGHSLGGLVIRQYLSGLPDYRGRVVMLSPPNRGSEIIDRLRELSWLRAQLGPAALVLGTRAGDLPRSLGPVRFELGVIMGTRSVNPIGSWMIPGPDDGAVSLEGGRVEGMSEYCLVPHTHTFIMWSRDVAELTGHFLRYGHFSSGCEKLETFDGAAE